MVSSSTNSADEQLTLVGTEGVEVLRRVEAELDDAIVVVCDKHLLELGERGHDGRIDGVGLRRERGSE